MDKSTGLRCDQIIRLYGFYSKQSYPEPLRRIRYYDPSNRRWLVFLTNNFTLPALTIAQLYRCRWQVELFFKWIKQHLRIKAFFGTSANAVKTQVWIAIASTCWSPSSRSGSGWRRACTPFSRFSACRCSRKSRCNKPFRCHRLRAGGRHR